MMANGKVLIGNQTYPGPPPPHLGVWVAMVVKGLLPHDLGSRYEGTLALCRPVQWG